MKKAGLLDQYGRPISSNALNNRYYASGYSHAAASMSKNVFKGWEWKGGSPDDDIIANLPIIRQRSRQLTMEAPVIKGLYKTMTTNVVGDGLRPEPTPDAEFLGMDLDAVKKFKSSVMRLWDIFAESVNCDVYHKDNFYELTRLAFRSQQESGDVFITMPRFERHHSPFALKIQIIEADCCADPDNYERKGHEENDIYGGVEISPWGNVIGYWFYTGHPLARRRTRNYTHNGVKYPRWIFIPAYGAETGLPNVLHLMETERPGQRRGLPIIAPIVELALTLDRYIKAEAIAAQVQAMFTLVVTSDNPDAIIGEMEAAEEDTARRILDDDELNDRIVLGPGSVQYARPGEKMEAVNPTRPNSAYDPFIKTNLEMIGPAVGVPYELMLQSYKNSFSASQAAMNNARSNFKVVRSCLVNDFCQPIWESFMDEAVLRGWIDAPGYFDSFIMRNAYTRAKWNGPGMPQLDLGKSAQNYEKLISLGFATASEATSELTGGNYYENVQERGREIAAAKDAGLPIAAAQGMTQTAGAIAGAEATNNNTEEGKEANG